MWDFFVVDLKMEVAVLELPYCRISVFIQLIIDPPIHKIQLDSSHSLTTARVAHIFDILILIFFL
jgi:hypothetical protein